MSPDQHRPANLLDPFDYHICQMRQQNRHNIMITTWRP
jgi:hypothetical protein